MTHTFLTPERGWGRRKGKEKVGKKKRYWTGRDWRVTMVRKERGRHGRREKYCPII